MDGGGAGGIGRGPLTSGMAGSATGVGATTTSGMTCVTITPERPAVRGSLRVINTDEMAGITTGAGSTGGTCILALTSTMGIGES